MPRLPLWLLLSAAACARPAAPPTQPPPVVVPAPTASADPGVPPPPRADAEFGPCTGAPTKAAVQQAKASFAAGRTAYEEGDYPHAVEKWRLAYQQDCTAHALLLNLSRAQELQGDRAAAARTLRTYLERRPDEPDRQQIERRIQNLEGR